MKNTDSSLLLCLGCPWDGRVCRSVLLCGHRSIHLCFWLLIHPVCVCVLGGWGLLQHPSLTTHYTKCQTNTPVTPRCASFTYPSGTCTSHTFIVVRVLTDARFHCCSCERVHFQSLALNRIGQVKNLTAPPGKDHCLRLQKAARVW